MQTSFSVDGVHFLDYILHIGGLHSYHVSFGSNGIIMQCLSSLHPRRRDFTCKALVSHMQGNLNIEVLHINRALLLIVCLASMMIQWI